MKKIIAILLGVLLFTSIVFGQVIDADKLSNSLVNKGFKVRVDRDGSYNPAFIYYTFTKREGQLELFIDLSVRENGDFYSAMIKSTHSHMKPNKQAIKTNFSQVKAPFSNAISDAELKTLFNSALTNFPKLEKGKKYDVQTIEIGNAIQVEIGTR